MHKPGAKRYKFGLIVDLVSGAFHNLALTDSDEVKLRMNVGEYRLEI